MNSVYLSKKKMTKIVTGILMTHSLGKIEKSLMQANRRKVQLLRLIFLAKDEATTDFFEGGFFATQLSSCGRDKQCGKDDCER